MTRSKKFDIILIASLILLSAAAMLCIFLFAREGKSVEVKIDGRVAAVYSLDTDGEYSLNGGTNTLVIKSGEAYIAKADCPDGTCMRAGRLRHVGQSAVCLPNRVSITVIGGDVGAVDLVS